jgi:tetratricopeptide (TPR) repeat protein
LWPLTVGASGVLEGLIVALIVAILSWLRIRVSGKVEIEFGPAGFATQEPSIQTEPLPTDFDDVVRLISWEVELAPLVGRDRERAKLIEWAQDNSGPRVRILLLTGPGGSGKSRLAADVARALRDRPFWQKWRCVGVVGKGRTKLTSLPAFLIIDDPEDRRASVLEILGTLAEHQNEKRAIRVLLLSRDPKERWDNDLGAAKLRGKVDKREVPLSPLTDDDAAKLYQTVTLRLATTYGKTKPQFLPAEFKRWLSQNLLHYFPLYLTAAAIHAVRDNDQRFTLGAGALIVSLAQRELDRLRAVSTIDNGFGRESLPRLAAIAIARGGLEESDIGRLAAADVADEQLGLLFPRAGSQIDVVYELKRLPWWKAGSWQIGAPDVVAASILYEVWKTCDVGPAEWLWLSLQGLGAEDCNRVGRLGYDIDIIYGHDDGKQFAIWLAECVGDDAQRAAALEPLVLPSPLPPALWRLAIRIYETLAEQALLQGPAADEDRARLLNNLSNRLSDSGDRAGALRAIEEAVEIYRRLAQAQPAAFEPNLAASLNNLSGQLSDSGDRAGALRAIEEAVEIRRRLAQAQPAAFEPNLAKSLNNLSNQLSDSGDRAGALRASKEATEILRRL